MSGSQKISAGRNDCRTDALLLSLRVHCVPCVGVIVTIRRSEVSSASDRTSDKNVCIMYKD